MGYRYSRSLTIDHTKVPNTDQTNFPVLFSGTYAYLATVANGGKVTNSNGYDIIITSDADGATKLDHEIETYTATTGAVNFWVRVPTVSHTTDTVIYLWYGNSAITTSQENVTGVWDSNFRGVWHLPNGSTLTANDSTSHANHGTLSGSPLPSAVAAQIDGGANFNATGYIDMFSSGDPGSPLTITGYPLTISCWVYLASLGGIYGYVDKNYGGSGEYQLASNAGVVTFTTNTDALNSTTPLSAGTIYYLVCVQSASNKYIYINGVQNASNATPSSMSANGIHYTLGAAATGAYRLNGALDEVRISNVVRSADWIATEYNNQSSPSTFYAVGNEYGPLIVFTESQPHNDRLLALVVYSRSAAEGSTSPDDHILASVRASRRLADANQMSDAIVVRIPQQYRPEFDSCITTDAISAAIQSQRSRADTALIADTISVDIEYHDVELTNRSKPISRPRWLCSADISGTKQYSSEDLEA
jgi:hypothetical protein